MEPYTLTGQGFVLDPLTPRDIDRVRDCCQDPEIQRWTTVPSPYSRADAVQFITVTAPQNWQTDHERAWAIREITTHGTVLVGTTGLRPDGDGSAEIGYWLAADARGRGLGTAAVRLAVRHALDPGPGGMGQRRVLVRIIVGNRASRALAVRAGFAIEGTIRSEIIQRGQPVDCWVGTVIAGDPAMTAGTWNDTPLQAEVVRPV
jgi:RimJ/RimL family protein N-acetyltransferase